MPGYSRGGEDNTLGEPIAACHLYFRVGKVEHLHHDLVIWARIIRIDDADAVGDHQTALERRAASSEDTKEVTGGYLNDQAGPHEHDLSR